MNHESLKYNILYREQQGKWICMHRRKWKDLWESRSQCLTVNNQTHSGYFQNDDRSKSYENDPWRRYR